MPCISMQTVFLHIHRVLIERVVAKWCDFATVVWMNECLSVSFTHCIYMWSMCVHSLSGSAERIPTKCYREIHCPLLIYLLVSRCSCFLLMYCHFHLECVVWVCLSWFSRSSHCCLHAIISLKTFEAIAFACFVRLLFSWSFSTIYYNCENFSMKLSQRIARRQHFQWKTHEEWRETEEVFVFIILFHTNTCSPQAKLANAMLCESFVSESMSQSLKRSSFEPKEWTWKKGEEEISKTKTYVSKKF